MPFPPRSGTLLAVLFSALLAGGCSNRGPRDELATAVAMGERPFAMTGSGAFFGQQLRVTVTVSRGIGHGAAMGHSKGSGPKRNGEGLPDLSGMDNDEATAYLRAKAQVGSPMPPVTLHLKIENLGAKTGTVQIIDFNSDLGNFALHPETLAIAPAQTAEPDPMISQMGVGADVIPFQVTLKMDGRRETQTISVRNVMTPANEH